MRRTAILAVLSVDVELFAHVDNVDFGAMVLWRAQVAHDSRPLQFFKQADHGKLS